MVIYLYEQLESTSLCQKKIQRKPLLVCFFNHLICCHHPFCTAGPNERELVVLTVQKKHIYKLIVSPVYSSNRTVNNLTGKKVNSDPKCVIEKKKKAKPRCASQSKACQAKTAVYNSGEKFRGNELTQNSCRKYIKHYMARKTRTKAMKETNEVLGYVFYNPCYLSLKLHLLQIRPVKCNCSHFPAQITKLLF